MLSFVLLAIWAGPPAQSDSLQTLTHRDLVGTGRAALSDALQVLLPSFNFPRPSGAEWTDQVRPATLRGLAANQVLVLVNGVPLHQSALLHQNPTVGRGTASVDLDAIPLAAVLRVEVLRNAVSGRYGSGGMVGTINVVIGAEPGGEATSSLGFVTSGGVVARNAVRWSAPWGTRGMIHLAGEYRVRGATDAAEPDHREQFFPGDPRNLDPRFADRVHDRRGDPLTRNAGGWARAVRTFGGIELEAVIGLNRRTGQSAALWRRPSDDGTVRSLYPTGFLPLLNGRILDVTAHLTGRGSIRGWGWEASAGYGSNTIRMELTNSANASLGGLSSTSFSAGTLGAVRLLGDVRVRRSLPLGSLVTVGGQVLGDGFRIAPGERDSYRYGGVPIQDGPNAGGIAPVGSQGYPGFMPRDSGHTSQQSIAGYVEARTRPLTGLTLAAEGRVEAYTGTSYGTLPAGAIRALLQPIGGVQLRGELAAGFRVPSEAEREFSRSLIPVVNGVGLYDLLVPATHPVALSLGAPPLRAERSTRWGAGLDLSARGFTFSADYSDLRVRRLVALTEKFSGSAVRFFLESQGFDGVGAVQFLANVGNTWNRGVELRAGYETDVAGFRARVDAAFSHFETEVIRVDSIAGFARQFQSVFFGPRERAAIESGQPRDNALGSARLTRRGASLELRVRRYGSVQDYGPSPDGSLSQRLGAKWLADTEVRYAVSGRVTVTAGIQNLLGTRPDRLTIGTPEFAGNSYFGILPYSNFSPFGWNGRFAYAQVQWQLVER